MEIKKDGGLQNGTSLMLTKMATKRRLIGNQKHNE